MNANSLPDLAARAATLNIQQSFLVQAPAGSGKTSLLTQRFLKLLTNVETPEEIIAITFTQKAANEMRDRIINALTSARLKKPENDYEEKTYALSQQVLTRSQQKQWHLEKHPNRLRILTMDALSLHIAQRLPISSKMGSQCDISADPQSLYRQAIKMTLLESPEKAPWLQDIKTLLLHLDNQYDKCEDLFVSLLEKRDQWLPLMLWKKNEEEKRKALEKELSYVNKKQLEKAKSLLTHELYQELDALLIFSQSHLGSSLDTQENSLEVEKQYWEKIANLVLTQNNQLRKKADKNIGFPAPSTSKNHSEKQVYEDYKMRYQQLIQRLSSHHDFIETLCEIKELPSLTYSEQAWQVLTSLLNLLPLTTAQLRLLFAQTGKTDYIENAQSALSAFGDPDQPSDISLYLDNSLRHILVDEFQDTSIHQFTLLEKLTSEWIPGDGRTLFLVGDPMQSIYRFRQAEVGLFLHAKHHGLGKIHLHFVQLQCNFRSTQQVVQWINEKFSVIFPKHENIALGAISYTPSYAVNEESVASRIIEAYFSDALDQEEEKYIIEKIKSIKKEYPNDSVAILVRARDHLKNIIPLLQSANIHYQAAEIESLFHKPIIQDLLSLTRACLHLGDRIAWLACLRAPWCGLKLEDLWKLTHKSPQKTLWYLMHDETLLENLHRESYHRLIHFREAIRFAIWQRQRLSLRDIVETVWKNLQGEKLLCEINEQQDVMQFFSLIDKLMDDQGLFHLDSLEKKVQSLFSAPMVTTEPNPIHLMTIHKAKGLEFDHVFLPKLEKKSPADQRALLAWCEYPDEDNTQHILMAPLHENKREEKTYRYIQKQQQKKSLLELDRLFYVAVTRAKKCLYLSATLSEEKPTASSYSLLGRAEKALDLESTGKPASLNPETSYLQKKAGTLNRIAIDYMPSPQLLSSGSYADIQNNLPSLALASHREEAKIGSMIHLWIEKISKLGTTWWLNIDKKHQQSIIKALAAQYQLNTATNKIERALSNLIHDSRAQWILTKRKVSFNELSLHSKTKNGMTQSIIDCLFLDETGSYWIIDFKTTEDVEKAANDYKHQLKTYKQVVEKILPSHKIQAALYFPLLPAWYVYPEAALS